MKWINGITISVCILVIGAKGILVVWEKITPSLEKPLQVFGIVKEYAGSVQSISFDSEDLTKLDWGKQNLTPQTSGEKNLKVTSTAHQTGCANLPEATQGINTAQWIDFKSSYSSGLDEENVAMKLGSYYCLIAPVQVHLKEYRSAVASGQVYVARYLPANDLSETNVLDIYFAKGGQVLTYELYKAN